MADWIKMRTSLLTNPKVTKMARTLLANPEFREWYGNPEVTDNMTHAVTLRHVTVVTRVTVGGLLPVWASVNESAGRDGHLRHAGLFEIDVTAGIPGFGAAMEVVDWLTVLPENDGLEFANFIEHNTPGQERSTHAKTNAERAKEYRDRKAAEKAAGVTNDVTKNRDASRDTVTTDKKRVDKNSPSLRSGEDAGKPTARKKREDTILKTYLAACKQAGVRPLSADHPIRDYCTDAHITDEMLQLAWIVFKDRFTTGKDKAKRQKDWPAHFANSVRGRWANLWHTTEKGETCWTSAGLQERAVAEARMKPHQGDSA